MSIVNTGFTEFLEQNTKDLAAGMPWMEGRQLKLCESLDELRADVDAAIQAKRCALDTETTGLNTRHRKVRDPVAPGGTRIEPSDHLVGLSLSSSTNRGIYVPVRHQEDPALNLPLDLVLHEVQRLVSNTTVIFQNAKFDIAMLRNHGVRFDDPNGIEDTMILARLYDAGQKSIGLKDLSKRLLKRQMIEFDQVSGVTKRFDLISPRIGSVYAASDAVCTWDLYDFLMAQPTVQAQSGVYTLEKRVLFVVMAMEANLVMVNVPYLTDFQTKTAARLSELEKNIHRMAGREFNVGSPAQLAKVLFDEKPAGLGYPYTGKVTEAGKLSTDDAVLTKMKGDYPIIPLIIEYRELQKVLGSYIDKLVENHDEDNCVKFAFSQVGTDTGRFSSPGGKGIKVDGYSGLNVQSLPKPKEQKEDEEVSYINMRHVFVARPGFKILAMDFSNEEMRVAANLSREPVWVDAFLNDQDLHEKAGQIIYGRPNITKKERGVGKTVDFATLYGGGPRRISEVIGCSEMEARKIQQAFFKGLPTLKKWMDDEVRAARRSKVVTTAFGRMRPLHYLYDSGDKAQMAHADRCVCNTLIQGGCADIMKLVMVRVGSWIQKHNYEDVLKILLTMHDELVYEVKEDMLDYFVPHLNSIMVLTDILQGDEAHGIKGLGWPVPLKLDAEWGDSWDVENDYFKDHPEARESVPPIIFHQPQQVTGRFGIAVARAVESDKPAEKAEATAEPVEPPAVETPTEASSTPEAAPEAVQSEPGMVLVGAQPAPVINDTDVVYTLRDRRESTGRLCSMIMGFLEREERSKVGYRASKRRLVLKDPDGNSMLVEDVYVNPDLFVGVARFLGI